MVFGVQYVFEVIRDSAQRTYNVRPYFTNMLMIVFYGGIGLILGLEHLFTEIEKEGKWKINLPRIILIGIPSLYFSLSMFIYYTNNQIIDYPIYVLLKGNSSFISVFQLILGYSFITSFYKGKEEV